MSQTVRAYLPATFGALAVLRAEGELPAGPAYAVTPDLRARLQEDDQEALEYEAFTRAAQASLGLLRADPMAARRRVVISVDAPVEPDQGDRVRLAGPVPLAAVAAIHVDGTAVEPAVVAAVAGEAAVDEALEWYDVSELALLAP